MNFEAERKIERVVGFGALLFSLVVAVIVMMLTIRTLN